MITRTDDFRSGLEDSDGEFPESWRPEVGDLLVGTVVRYETSTTQYGDAHICVVKDEITGNDRSVWLLYTVLRGEFKKQRPMPGERVGVKRLADAAKGYRRYVVLVDRQERQIPDFDAFGESGDAELDHPDTEKLEITDDIPF